MMIIMMIIVMSKKSNIISDLMAQPVERSNQYCKVVSGPEVVSDWRCLSLYVYLYDIVYIYVLHIYIYVTHILYITHAKLVVSTPSSKTEWAPYPQIRHADAEWWFSRPWNPIQTWDCNIFPKQFLLFRCKVELMPRGRPDISTYWYILGNVTSLQRSVIKWLLQQPPSDVYRKSLWNLANLMMFLV